MSHEFPMDFYNPVIEVSDACRTAPAIEFNDFCLMDSTFFAHEYMSVLLFVERLESTSIEVTPLVSGGYYSMEGGSVKGYICT